MWVLGARQRRRRGKHVVGRCRGGRSPVLPGARPQVQAAWDGRPAGPALAGRLRSGVRFPRHGMVRSAATAARSGTGSPAVKEAGRRSTWRATSSPGCLGRTPGRACSGWSAPIGRALSETRDGPLCRDRCPLLSLPRWLPPCGMLPGGMPAVRSEVGLLCSGPRAAAPARPRRRSRAGRGTLRKLADTRSSGGLGCRRVCVCTAPACAWRLL